MKFFCQIDTLILRYELNWEHISCTLYFSKVHAVSDINLLNLGLIEKVVTGRLTGIRTHRVW